MEPGIEDYRKILADFYRKVAKVHDKNFLTLNSDFNKMVEEVIKGDNASYIKKRERRPPRDMDDVSADGSRSARSKSIRGTNKGRSLKKDYLFKHEDLNKVFVFSYLYFLIQTSNKTLFDMIETKSKLLLETVSKEKIQKINSSSNVSNEVWSKDYLGFKKIMHLINHNKGSIRWERILKDVIKDINDVFIDVMLRAILNLNATASLEVKITPDKFEKIAAQLKVSFCYFEYDKGEIEKKTIFGSSKYELKIGLVTEDNNYAFFQKFPSNDLNASDLKRTKSNLNNLTPPPHQNQATGDSPREVNNDSKSPKREPKSPRSKRDRSPSDTSNNNYGGYKTIKRRALRTIATLLTEYEMNTMKFEDLNCFKSDQSKESKIKKLLQERRKGEN